MPKKEFLKGLVNLANDRMRIKLEYEKGELKDVVFQYESFIDGHWREIVRFDCAHGFFHKDEISPNGDKEKTKIFFPSLGDFAVYAENDIKDRWEWYKERYIKKIKK